MAARRAGVEVAQHDSQGAATLLDAFCVVYADAYGVEPGIRTTSFRDRAERAAAVDGHALVTAMADGEILGFAFGDSLPEKTRWREGLQPDPGEAWRTEDGTRTFVLPGIEVRRAWQGSGVGRLLHDPLVEGRAEERATLATSPDAEVQPVHERWGWQKLGRVPGTDNDYHSAYGLFVLPLDGKLKP